VTDGQADGQADRFAITISCPFHHTV